MQYPEGSTEWFSGDVLDGIRLTLPRAVKVARMPKDLSTRPTALHHA